MNKFRILLVSIFVAFGFAFSSAVPAEANVDWWKRKCDTNYVETIGPSYHVETCIRVGWRNQLDGTGIHVEQIEIKTVTGCGNLDDKKTYNQSGKSYNIPEDNLVDTVNLLDGFSCNNDYNVELGGAAIGATRVAVHGTWDLHLANNDDFHVAFTLCKDNGC